MCTDNEADEHTDSGNSGDNLPKFKFVQDGGFSCCVQPHHQNTHLLLPNQAFQQVPKNISHGAVGSDLSAAPSKDEQFLAGPCSTNEHTI